MIRGISMDENKDTEENLEKIEGEQVVEENNNPVEDSKVPVNSFMNLIILLGTGFLLISSIIVVIGIFVFIFLVLDDSGRLF